MTMATRTTTETRRLRTRAERILAAEQLRAPATRANTARNARAEYDRHARWAPAREALWRFLDVHLPDGARVAIVGAGSCDDLPLERIAARADEVTLMDLDKRAIRAARRRQPRPLRGRIDVVEHDVTGGAANGIAIAAAADADAADADAAAADADAAAADADADADQVPEPVVSEAPVPGAPYDLVIGDLLYSQLLYPALVDLGVPAARTSAYLVRYAPRLTRSVVARLHVSAPGGLVLHVHDPIAWWPGHPQPVTLEQILTAAERDPAAALALAAQGQGPRDSDPRAALSSFAIPVRATAMWRWPFAAGVDYLACATLAGGTS